MSSKPKNSGSARTEPKGRATRPRSAQTGRRSFLAPWMEWALAVIVITAILTLIFIIFGDARSTQAATSADVESAVTSIAGSVAADAAEPIAVAGPDPLRR